MTARSYRDRFYGGRQFLKELIILCVRWYVTCRLSYRDLAEMMVERGVHLTHSTVLRWVIRLVPEFVKRWERHRRPVRSSWRADETYISINGEWHYLYRAADKRGRTVDFHLSRQRDIRPAMTFFRKAVASHPNNPPRKITVAGYRATHRAPRLLRLRNPTSRRDVVRSSQYLNNTVEQDHRAMKRKVSAMLGFKTPSTAATTLMGVELAHRIRKQQFSIGNRRGQRHGSRAGAWALAVMQRSQWRPNRTPARAQPRRQSEIAPVANTLRSDEEHEGGLRMEGTMRRSAFAALMLLAHLVVPRSAQSTPLDVYGRLPSLEEVVLSPDGSRLAFVRTQGDTRTITIVSLADQKPVGALGVGEHKLRSLEWADEDHLVIVTSKTGVPLGYTGRDREWSLMQVYDLTAKRLVDIPDPPHMRGVRMLNAVAGSAMVRRAGGHTLIFVPGVLEDDFNGEALFRIDLQTNVQTIARTGRGGSRWLVDENGELSAEEDYDERTQRWVVRAYHDGKGRDLASGSAVIDVPMMLGYGPTPDSILMEFVENGQATWRLMSLADGSVGTPLAGHQALNEPIEDPNSQYMIGGVRVDDDTQYVFFDEARQRRWNSVVAAFPGAHVRLVSETNDFSKFVIRVDGVTQGYVYELVDMKAHHAIPLGAVYKGLDEVLPTRRITYKAGDGLEIPAYLTLPGGREAKALPLVVAPHGGPAARDTADFDWWAQAMANEGYAVLRPNYRGSALSEPFLEVGFGEWGRKMQTDLSDGVRYLVREGIADPARVCIVGASYGGYAALAGVTLDPGTYRCAASVAGLSDLKRLLDWVDGNHSSGKSLEQRYWDRFMGVTGPKDPQLDALSPVRHVDVVTVPVLLIHGRDDTVVPIKQSTVMLDAMRRVGKQANLVAMPHEDHWLSRSETRLQMLRTIVEFLRANNPPNPKDKSNK
jgi:dipeptidyl aminopeptidase/acylaminoacyl peptidase/transposase-like protein